VLLICQPWPRPIPRAQPPDCVRNLPGLSFQSRSFANLCSNQTGLFCFAGIGAPAPGGIGRHVSPATRSALSSDERPVFAPLNLFPCN
jgi:hypothetical protein